MTLADTPPTRRTLRAETGAVPAKEPEKPSFDAAAAAALGQPLQGKPGKPGKEPRRVAKTPRIALSWVDEATVAQTELAPRDLSAASASYVAVDADLLARAPRRSPFRAGVLVPIAIIAALIGGYSGTTLLWPLHAVAPEIEAVQVASTPAPASAIVWPAEGSGAIAVTGFDGTLASTQDAAAPIASITKVVTALLVLDELPLAVGEQGQEYSFTSADRSAYWSYRARGESALDVPAGGTLTQYQLLEGMLIGSANNYADKLASLLWPSDAVYADAARNWLAVHGVPGITIVEPTGFDSRNRASAASLISLGQKALANPVIAEIVAKTSTDLPGAGLVTNTNSLLADAGVIGVKTGSLDDFTLLAAKDIAVGETPVRAYAAVLGQDDDEARVEATRALFGQLEQELQLRPSVLAGTTVGVIDTAWGQHVEVRTDADASVVLWNGATGTLASDLSLGDDREAGDTVGALTVTGPLGATTVDVSLAGDIEPPSGWWRLGHPLELFGLAG